MGLGGRNTHDFTPQTPRVPKIGQTLAELRAKKPHRSDHLLRPAKSLLSTKTHAG
jgi:hypothetical protein